jgi:hypothetical protein
MNRVVFELFVAGNRKVAYAALQVQALLFHGRQNVPTSEEVDGNGGHHPRPEGGQNHYPKSHLSLW